MTGEELNKIHNETAVIYELYGFQMPFTEFKDIFEFGAAFGLSLSRHEEEKIAEIPDSNTQQLYTKNFVNSTSVAKHIK